MDNKEFIRLAETRLAELGMKKGDFYKLTGVTSASYSNRNTGKTQEKSLEPLKILGIFCWCGRRDLNPHAVTQMH